MMVMRDVVGTGEAERSWLCSGGEGADARAMRVRQVDHEEHLLWGLQGGEGVSAGVDTCNVDRAAVVVRDIDWRPGVIVKASMGDTFSTGAGTGRVIRGDGGWATGIAMICSHTSWTTSRIILLASSGIRHIARFPICL
jgi:hypothetical protein